MSRARDHKRWLIVVEAYLDNGENNLVDACRKAGWEDGKPALRAAQELPKNKNFVALLAERRASRKKANEQADLERARAQEFTNSDIQHLAWKIANNCWQTEPKAAVAALDFLADVRCMKVKTTRDATEQFSGWTQEEIRIFAEKGVRPERFRGTSQSPSVH